MRYTSCVLAAWVGIIGGTGLAAEAEAPAKTVVVDVSAVDAQKKVLWSLQVATSLTLTSAGDRRSSGGGEAADESPVTSTLLCMDQEAVASQAIEVSGSATTRPTKWMGKRELRVEKLELAKDGFVRVRLAAMEKIPTGSAEAPEYVASGVETTLRVEPGKERNIGGAAERQLVMKVTIEK